MNARGKKFARELGEDLFVLDREARKAVRHIPDVAVAMYREIDPAAATARVERMVFSIAATALGFAGDPLPSMLVDHAGSHEVGALARKRFDVLARRSK